MYPPLRPFHRLVLLAAWAVAFTPVVSATDAPAPVLKAAARTFSIQPQVGWPAKFNDPQGIREVIGDLKGTVVLFEYGSTRLCFVTSSLDNIQGAARGDTGSFGVACRRVVVKELALAPTEVVLAGSHNHTMPAVAVSVPLAWGRDEDPPAESANEPARAFLQALGQAARGLDKELVPVSVEWGVAEEKRVTYNRRGRRPDGRSYLIRTEEERQQHGPDYTGVIDPDAKVMLLRGESGRPVAALAFFTGHPVTGFNPEVMVSFGQWSQVACEILSGHLGGIPVGFLQGCAGDVNSKYMLTGTIQQGIELGRYLGESYIAAVGALHRSKRPGLQWSREKVRIPHADLPVAASLERDLASIDDFIRRGRAGDQDTLECVGLNFHATLTPPYRAQLVESVRPWYVWALDQHRAGKAAEVPKFLEMDIVVARIGDVGFVGLPFEPFVRTGLKIKREAPLPCVFTSGYTGDSTAERTYGYIPDASAVDDREYMSGYFRYVAGRPPYRSPAGDAAAEVAVAKLTEFSR